MLQRPEENNDWQPGLRRTVRPHDDDNDDVIIPRHNYFGAARFYCVETITAPCGVVIAWVKFDKSESPTNILNWLEKIYPTEESQPHYICIDKACQVLRTAIANGSWNRWKIPTRFIVDSYHYINHHTLDYLCCKWCNPGPLNGSAPNLVKVAYDKTKLGFVKCCKDLVKISLGNPEAEGQTHSNMMIQMQTLLNLKTTFVQQGSIVLKLFVPLVVLLLPGQNLQNQDHQQTF